MIRILFFLMLFLSVSYGNDTLQPIVLKEKKQVEIEMESIKLEDQGIAITFKKFINKNLTNVKVTLSEGNKSIESNHIYNYAYPPVETNNSLKLYLPSQGVFGYSFGKGHNFTITINANEIKSYKFEKYVKFKIPEGIFYILAMITFMLILTPYFLYMGLFNRTLQKIMLGDSNKIFDIPFKKLPYYKKVIKRRLKKEYFEEYFISDFDEVVQFFEVANNEKADIFAKRANGKVYKIDDNIFEIKLASNFELSVESFLLYFTNGIEISKVIKDLKHKGSHDFIIVIGENEKEQKQINESKILHKLPYALGIFPRDLKVFLLKEGHTKTLSKILSIKMDRKLLSPYQEEGQLRNESYFFGRKKIIDHIYNRELSNYFIVGARQIGKSSLLKALELKFKKRDDIVCFTFADTRYLLKDMARALKLDKNSSLEEIEFFIADSPRKYLFIIDEADEFVKNEKNSAYKTLHAFRSLTQKRKAYFIMAGYYELYSQISFDYHSPIKNFGETIRLGKLEIDACIELIITPMENLGLFYQDANHTAKIFLKTGQRANLVAMVCADIIKNLKPYSNEITKDIIDKALECEKVKNTHYEWNNTNYTTQRESYIIQIIVYASVRVEYFNLKGIIDFFKNSELIVTMKEIAQSLKQLELMYILEKNNNDFYYYTIPLMQEELKKDADIMLERVSDEFRKNNFS